MRNIEGCKTFAAVISLSFILPGLAVAKDQALERKKNKTPVELLMQVEQLRNETQILRGLVEELTKKIETIEGAFEEKHTDLNSRLTKIFEAQKKAIESAESAVLSQKNNNFEMRQDSSRQLNPSADEAYANAFNLIRSRNFNEGLAAMSQFIVDYSGHELVDNAKFWRGQVFKVQNRDKEAIEVFEELLRNVPSFNKILQVKIKLGGLYMRNGQEEEGRILLESVIAEAPNSVEAGLARRDLSLFNVN